jgi:hypothetical protein
MRKLIRRLARVALPPLAIAGLLATPGVASAASVTCQGWTGGQPANPGSFNELQSVAVQSSCSLWAVGDFFNLGTGTIQTLAEHWTGGSSWTRVPTPSPGAGDDLLFGISSVAAGNLWAVGQQDNSLGTSTALIEHGNGTSWKTVPSHAPGFSNSLDAVAAASAANAWAVGIFSATADGVLHPLIERWNGTQWSAAANPLRTSEGGLFGLAVDSASDVWAVGSLTPADGHSKTLIEHWDGTAWARAPSPSPGIDDTLTSVSINSPTDAWAVGITTAADGTRHTLAEHWNGAGWAQVPTPSPAGVGGLFAVRTVSASDAWALGAAADDTVLLHWDGRSWQAQQDLQARFGALGGGPARGNVWAVGEGGSDNAASAWAEPLGGVPQFEAVVNQSNQALGEFGLVSGHPPGAAKVAPGSSPSVAAHDGGAFEAAWRATNGDLWTVDSAGHVTDLNVKVAAGTNPSVAAVGSDGFVIAFVNAADGTLWEKVGNTLPPSQVHGGLAVAPGTSPAVAGDLDGEFEIAFASAATGDVVRADSGGVITDPGVKMAAGSSPAIAELAIDNFETAFVSSDGTLADMDQDGTVNHLAVPVAAGTSPAIAAGNTGFEIAVQHADTGELWAVAADGSAGSGQIMAAGTSPALTVLPSGAFQFAYQSAETGNLTTFQFGGAPLDRGVAMAAGTSPAITAPAAPLTPPPPPPPPPPPGGSVTVPNFLGQDAGSVEVQIGDIGLTVGTVRTAPECSDTPGDVVAQDPIGGARVARGTAVDLTVSACSAARAPAPHLAR